jgi:hypothetical protein
VIGTPAVQLYGPPYTLQSPKRKCQQHICHQNCWCTEKYS